MKVSAVPLSLKLSTFRPCYTNFISWLLRLNSFSSLFSTCVCSNDIHDILTLVNYSVGKADAPFDQQIYKQSPAPLYTLRKKLIFSPL